MRFFVILLALFGVWYLWDNTGAAPELSVPAALVQKIYTPPLQNEVKIPGIPFKKGRLEFLASYEVTARVLSRTNYHFDAQSEISPTDFALGWGPMSMPNISKGISISQSGRWYHYSWSGTPPIDPEQIPLNSANTHIIPANDEVAKQIAHIKKNQFVTLQGYLIYYREEDDNGSWWDWRSSLSRSDTGDGSCEVMYVMAVTVY
jgi:hypothetical protein